MTSTVKLPIPPHLLPGRKASWFELFFDLAFVTAVAQLTAALSHHFDVAGFAQFVVLLLLLWWTWLGHTFHSTRFDEGRLGQHVLGMFEVAAVILIAYGAGAAFGERALPFALGMAALKLLLALAYLRELQRPGARGLALTYAAVYTLQALLWLASAAVDAPVRWGLWTLVLLLDIASPWLVARHTHGYPPHPEHLPERFGLFTIIVMGEGVASTLHALLHAGALGLRPLTLAALGLALSFLYWLVYFERIGAQHELHVRDARGGRLLRLWAYGHVPLLIGVAGGAAGLIAATGTEPSPLGPWLTGVCIAFAIVGLSLIGEARRALADGAGGQRAKQLLLAALPVLAAAAGSVPAVLVVGVFAAIGQVLLARSHPA